MRSRSQASWSVLRVEEVAPGEVELGFRSLWLCAEARSEGMTEPAPDVIQGPALDCRPARRPERISLEGRLVRLESLSAERHAAQLYSGLSGPKSEALWRYLARGPFGNHTEFGRELEQMAAGSDPLFYAIVPRSTARRRVRLIDAD